MKFFLIIGCLFVSIVVAAQQDSIALKLAMQQLDKALLAKDSATLDRLLDKKLSYGHSNGWAQTKTDIWADFVSGKVAYSKIEPTTTAIVSIGNEWATVRMQSNVAGIANGKPFEMILHIMQVWKKEKKGWQLFARQSAKL